MIMSRIRTGRRRYYDIFSHFYDWFIRLHSHDDREETRAFLVDSAQLEKKASPRILDVCCGTGSGILFFEARFPNALSIGYDFSYGMLLHASRKDASHGLFLVEGDAALLPFRDDLFDAVCCSHALYELKGPARKSALLEMKRVSRPGGRVLIMEHEVPRKPFIKLLFRIRMFIMGSTDSSEFLKQGASPFKEIFPVVTLTHTKSGKSKLFICGK